MYIQKILMTFVFLSIFTFGTMSFFYSDPIIPGVNYWDFGNWYVSKLDIKPGSAKELEFQVNSVMSIMYIISILWLLTPQKYLKND